MESAEKPVTPRRSERIQRMQPGTPDIPVPGPRELMKLNRSRQKADLDQSKSSKNAPIEINIIPSTPISAKKRRITLATKTTAEESKEKKNVDANQTIKEADVSKDPVTDENKNGEAQIAEEKRTESEMKETVTQNEDQIIQSPETEEFHSAINENADGEKTIEPEETNKDIEKAVDVMEERNGNEIKEVQEDELNKTPQLMDESIISVPESPPLTTSTAAAPIKDSTFSPEVDTSIKDARPHIENTLNMTPILPRNVTLRTSTPLTQRIFLRDTPKLSEPVLKALNKLISPKSGASKRLNEDSLSETFNGQFKMGNPLEKSILKSSRRKRSLSVTDGESFMQKKVAFMSPEIMNIDTIDEKMLQSFKEEKESSMLKQVLASGSGMRRKRSFSECGSPSKAKMKVPNFKAIHEQQFKKMEALVDNKLRIAERAKRFNTPTKILTPLPEIKEKTSEKVTASKIPTRKPLVKVSSSENAMQTVKNRPMKRSNSVETQQNHTSSSKIAFSKEPERKVGTGAKLPRSVHANTKVTTFTASSSTSIAKASSSSQSMRAKVEERRERNMSMYKGNAVKVGLDFRKKNENILKGVRLNRRFELQMEHRRMEESEEKN